MSSGSLLSGVPGIVERSRVLGVFPLVGRFTVGLPHAKHYPIMRVDEIKPFPPSVVVDKLLFFGGGVLPVDSDQFNGPVPVECLYEECSWCRKATSGCFNKAGMRTERCCGYCHHFDGYWERDPETNAGTVYVPSGWVADEAVLQDLGWIRGWPGHAEFWYEHLLEPKVGADPRVAQVLIRLGIPLELPAVLKPVVKTKQARTRARAANAD